MNIFSESIIDIEQFLDVKKIVSVLVLEQEIYAYIQTCIKAYD
jgi:hypothetical protein